MVIQFKYRLATETEVDYYLRAFVNKCRPPSRQRIYNKEYLCKKTLLRI